MKKKKLVIGFHAVRSRIRHDAAGVEAVYIDATRKDRRMAEFVALAKEAGVRIIETDAKRLDDMSSRGPHQGVCAFAESIPVAQNVSELLDSLEGNALLVVLDGITDPHNLGACLRTADAAGAHAIIAPRDKSVSVNATVEKVASGAAQTVPFIAVTNLARTLRELKDAGVWVIGTSDDASKTLYDTDLKGPVALVMGAEGSGMRRLTRETCDELVSIPMAGSVESLNISVATAVCLYEAVRQRRQ